MKFVHGWAYPDADAFMANEMKPDGRYQGGHLEMALAHVTDWRVAIDGGAHCGTWSVPMARRFDRVIAVEPSPDTFEALVHNLASFHCENVDVTQSALGAEAGFVEMAPLDPRAEALKNTGARFVQAGTSIPRIRIDDWSLPACGFIKLDIEGSEVDALKGAAQTLTRCRPIVLWENKGFCRRFGYAKDAPQQFLASVGYHELAVAGCDRIWGPR